jgi:catechol 2,3-dioxygenase-like lactoylglutathione lyase family enzyme
MTIGINHLHVKTRDPKKTMQFYVENLGATVIAEMPDGSYRLKLAGLQLNVTGIIGSQKREQHYGLEHVAVDTDDYPGTIARFRENGAKVLEELPPNANGRRVGFVEAPDGAQIEIIEKLG